MRVLKRSLEGTVELEKIPKGEGSSRESKVEVMERDKEKRNKKENAGTRNKDELRRIVLENSSDETRISLGRFDVMFNPDEQDEFWNSQHEWVLNSPVLGEELARGFPRSIQFLGKGLLKSVDS
ncbi:hypothetical protein Tco_0529090 [Tanacetum coccineum]